MLDAGFKFLDVYKVDKKFNVSEDYSDKNSNKFLKNTSQDKVGSKIGGTFSLILFISVFSRFVI